MDLFNFEEDNLNVDDVIKWIYTTQDLQIIFFRHQGMISISTTRFGLRAGLFMLLAQTFVAEEIKEISKATSLSQL